MDPINKIDKHAVHFLSGGGEMGERIGSFDWSSTSLGPIETWPQSLRTSLSLILTSYYPLFFWWGEDYIQFYNDAYIPILGSKHPKSLGQKGKECWPEAWHLVEPMIQLVKQGESTFNKNTLLPLQRKGYTEECYFDFAYSPIRNESGEVAGIFAAVSETTDQVIHERRLGMLTELGRNMLEAKSVQTACQVSMQVLSQSPIDVPFALIYLKEGNEYQLAASCGLTSHPQARPERLLPEDNAPAWNIQQVLLSKQPYLEENVMERFGNIITHPWPEPSHAALISPITLPTQQEPIGIFIAGISPRKAFSDMYANFLGLLTGHIETAISNGKVYEEERLRIQRLVELDRAKTDFFNNVSHEFRTPLTLMLAPLEEVLSSSESSLPDAEREQLTVVYQNALRLQKLVNTLLDFSRLSAKRAQASFEATDLCSFTSQLASAFESVAQKAGLQYQVACTPLSEAIYVDPDMWEKIVFNLISNAIKFTFEGQVTIGLQETATHAQLTVQDTGVGIPPSELPNLFKRFHRIPNIRSRSHEGTGIGLALVKELVEQHGGTIDVSSAPAQGTTFIVSIPKGSAHIDTEKIHSHTHTAATALKADAYINEIALWNKSGNALTANDTGSLTRTQTATEKDKSVRILLVDDNADMLQYLSRILSNYWEVKTVRNGVEALAAIRRETPDLVLSDVMMPHMNGFELLSKIRQDSQLQHLPVILLSARAGEEATIEGLEKGANDYLVKPFSAPELIARIRTQLEITSTREDNIQLKKIQEELRIYKIIIDHAFDPLLLVREDGSFAYVNNLALERWGYTREEVAHLKVADIDPLYQQAAFKRLFALSQKQNMPPFETIHKRKDGNEFPVEVSMGGITINGKPHQIAVVRDITERKKAEEALRKSEEHFSSIFNQTSVGIAETDLEGRYILVNDRYCQIVGRSKEELYQMRMQDISHQEDLPGNIPLFQRTVQEGIPFKIEKRYLRPDGSVIWVNNNVSLIKDATGKPQYIVAVSQDVTEHKLAEMALQESEERFRNMADAAPVIIWMGNTKGENLYFNTAWSQLTGRKPEEDSLYGWEEVIHPDDLAQTWEVYANALKNVEPFQLEFRVRRYDGHYRLLHCQGSPRRSALGDFMGFVGICEDITERRQAEEALKYQSYLVQSITDNATAGLFMMDVNGICTFMNPAAEEISGYTFEEIKQYPQKPLHYWVHFLHPDGRPYPIHECPIDRALPENNDIRAHEDVFVRRDGTFYNVSCAARPIIRDGVPTGTLVEVRDITERMQVAEALAKSEEHFRTFANNIQNLAWMANPDGVTYWYNQRWYEYTGTTFEDMHTFGWQKVIHPDHVERVAKHVIEAGLRNEEWELTIPLRAADGQYRWFLTRAYAVKDEKGKLVRWIGTNTDIQEQKAAEEELKEKNKELQKTNNDLDNFIYTASHDLKAPITNIEGLMHMLVRHLPQDSLEIPMVSQVISMTNASINRFKNTISDLTELTKLQRTLEDDISQVPLSELLSEICLDLDRAIQEAGATFDIDFSQCASIKFSKKNLRSIVYNLVSNAVKYRSPERKPLVRVYTQVKPGYNVLVVEDNGLGMDLSQENKLFTMFKRLHDHVEGTGLGLYIVKKIVENSGGKIEVQSELGKGSTFKVYFKQP